MNTPGSSFSTSLHPFPAPLAPSDTERPVPTVDASVVHGILSVRGPLLTVRIDDTLWVLRAGPDPRAWKKPLDRHGNGIGPWEPARPPLNELLRVPAAFPPAANEWIAACREKLKPVSEPSPVWDALECGPEFDDLRIAFQSVSNEVTEPATRKEVRLVWLCGRTKGTHPFPWAWQPGSGERRLRVGEPDPESIDWEGERPPSLRQWRRLPRGSQFGTPPGVPIAARDETFRLLRTTIRRVMLLRRHLPDWAALFPDGAMDFVERHRFSNRRWHLINLWLRVPGGRELWDDIPALAWLAASSWLYKTKPVKRPFRSLRALVKKPRACLLRWLDLPAGDGTLTLLRSVPGELMTPKFAHALCRVLRDEDKRRAWSNLRLGVTRRELSLLAYDLPISFPVLRLINEGSRVGPQGRQQGAEQVYVDCLKMIRLMTRDDELRPALARIRSGERLVAFHDELVAEVGRFERCRRFGHLLREPWEPPVPPVPWLVPIRYWDELQREGQAMRHCVASYDHLIAEGRYYVYAVHHPQFGRATLGLGRGRHSRIGWFVSELRGDRNEEVPHGLRQAVLQWLHAPSSPAPCLPGPVTGAAGETVEDAADGQLWLWSPEAGRGVPPADWPTTVGLDARVPLPFREDEADGEGDADGEDEEEDAAPEPDPCEAIEADDGFQEVDWDDEPFEIVVPHHREWDRLAGRLAAFRPIARPAAGDGVEDWLDEEEEAGDDDEALDWDDEMEDGDEEEEEVDEDTGEWVAPEADSGYEDAMAHHLAWSLDAGKNEGDDIPF